MEKLFYEGGPFFMSVLTLILSIGILFSLLLVFNVIKLKHSEWETSLLQSIGQLGLITGILAQLIGLYQAFSAIEQIGEVSQAMLMGGLKVSLITPIYGALIFITCYTLSYAIAIAMKLKREMVQ